MIIKTAQALEKMREAGKLLADIFEKIPSKIEVGISTAALDAWIEQELSSDNLFLNRKVIRDIDM